MADLESIFILLSALGSGVAAGIYFTFSNFVMAGLARLPPEQGIAAMQAINVSVLNRWFFLVFFGTGVTSGLLLVQVLLGWIATGGVYLALGAGLYILGSIGVTMACNVPLNRALAAVDPGNPEGEAVWQRYLVQWTRWNHLRTVACLAAAALFTVAWAS